MVKPNVGEHPQEVEVSAQIIGEEKGGEQKDLGLYLFEHCKQGGCLE